MPSTDRVNLSRPRDGSASTDDAEPAGRRIGILGDGQLGFMLCEAARGLGLETTVVSPRGRGPAVAAADDVIESAFDAPGLVDALVARTDAVTFEIEAIPGPLLRGLQRAACDGRVRVGPDAEILLMLQNKASQKHWLITHGLPTLPFRIISGRAGDTVSVVRGFGLPVVQKTQRGGYDGQGVQVLRDDDALERLWPVPSVIEPYVEERTEIAVVIARDAAGATQCYAPVEMTFDERHNILETVTSPASIPHVLAREATALAEHTVSRLAGVGVFAIEMFVTAGSGLVINEISPRVHNTGHHTLESCRTSQFEQHLRAVAGLPLGCVADERPAVMRNLLYTDALSPLLGAAPGVLPTASGDAFVHWYGKSEPRPFRKMGHATCLADYPAGAERRLDAALGELTAPSRDAAA